jgi:hypothetical protein
MARRTWYGRKRIETAPASLVSAAAPLVIGGKPTPDSKNTRWGGAQWQREAWDHYDTNPELHRAATIVGESFSRARLIVVDVDPVTGELGEDPTDNPRAGAVGATAFGGRPGQQSAQRTMGLHFTVPGETAIVVSDDPDLPLPVWTVLDVSEVSSTGSAVSIKTENGDDRILADGDMLVRIWQRHPRSQSLADSPARALLPVFREMGALTAQVMAAARSRLASAGVWLLPETAQLPAERDPETGEELTDGATGAERWLRMISDAMSAALSNPEDPSALVPIIAMVPDDVLDKIKDPFKFVADTIADVVAQRDAAVKRIAVGMDMPAEALTGLADSNHWTAWLVDESYIKGPLSSLLALPAEALTAQWLRPALAAAGVPNPQLFAYRFDVSHMLPAASDDAATQNAYSVGELSARAYLERLGFDPDRDAPTTDERAQRLLISILANATPDQLPDLVDVIKAVYGRTVDVPAVSVPAPAELAPRPGDTPSIPARPTALPDQSTPAAIGGPS